MVDVVISAKDARASGLLDGIKRNKYGAKRTTQDGIAFDSHKESKRYFELKVLETKGIIHSLSVHPKFKFAIGGRPVLIRSEGYPNGRQATFRPDFAYWDNERKCQVYEDVKGGKATVTADYKLRRAIFETLYFPARVEEV